MSYSAFDMSVCLSINYFTGNIAIESLRMYIRNVSMVRTFYFNF